MTAQEVDSIRNLILEMKDQNHKDHIEMVKSQAAMSAKIDNMERRLSEGRERMETFATKEDVNRVRDELRRDEDQFVRKETFNSEKDNFITVKTAVISFGASLAILIPAIAAGILRV